MQKLIKIYKGFSRKYKRFGIITNQSGSLVLELVIIIAITLALALIFNDNIKNFATNLFDKAFDLSNINKFFS